MTVRRARGQAGVRRRWRARAYGALAPLLMAAFAGSCGDVTTDLIVRDHADAECRQDVDCPPASKRCDVDAGRCVACLVRSDCPSRQTCSLPSGSCVQDCATGATCTGTRPVCDTSSGLCRACGADSECGEEAGHCDVASGRCAECVSNDDCRGEASLCNTSTGRCVECLTDGHCEEAEERCSSVLGECAVPCNPTVSCPSDDPICDPAVGFCVECSRDEDCGGDQSCRSSDCVDTEEMQQMEMED